MWALFKVSEALFLPVSGVLTHIEPVHFPEDFHVFRKISTQNAHNCLSKQTCKHTFNFYKQSSSFGHFSCQQIKQAVSSLSNQWKLAHWFHHRNCPSQTLGIPIEASVQTRADITSFARGRRNITWPLFLRPLLKSHFATTTLSARFVVSRLRGEVPREFLRKVPRSLSSQPSDQIMKSLAEAFSSKQVRDSQKFYHIAKTQLWLGYLLV